MGLPLREFDSGECPAYDACLATETCLEPAHCLIDRAAAAVGNPHTILVNTRDYTFESYPPPPRPGDHRLCTATGHIMKGSCGNCGATYDG